MVEPVWTSPYRKLAVAVLRDNGFSPARIGDALLMDMTKVRELLSELAKEEAALGPVAESEAL